MPLLGAKPVAGATENDDDNKHQSYNTTAESRRPVKASADAANTKLTLYDILGVKKSASFTEIKKAYHKKARKCHPDKFPGDASKTSEFQLISSAYNILKDERKRKVYDQLGEDGVKVMEQGMQNVSPEVLAAMFHQTSSKQRIFIFLVLIFIIAFLCSVPLFFILRVEKSIHWKWSITFIPLWVVDAVALFCGGCCIHSICGKTSSAAVAGLSLPEEKRHRFEVFIFNLSLLLFISVQINVVLKLDHVVSWSWYSVLIPWVLWEILSMTKLMYVAEKYSVFAAIKAADRQNIFRTRNFHCFVLFEIVPSVCRICFVFLLCDKLDDRKASGKPWSSVFIPLWILFAFKYLSFLWRRFLVKTRMKQNIADRGSGVDVGSDHTSKNEQIGEDSKGTIICDTIVCTLMLVTTVLLCIRLDGSNISIWEVILPFTIPLGLLCCCSSCIICLAVGSDTNDVPTENNDTGARNMEEGKV